MKLLLKELDKGQNISSSPAIEHQLKKEKNE